MARTGTAPVSVVLVSPGMGLRGAGFGVVAGVTVAMPGRLAGYLQVMREVIEEGQPGARVCARTLRGRAGPDLTSVASITPARLPRCAAGLPWPSRRGSAVSRGGAGCKAARRTAARVPGQCGTPGLLRHADPSGGAGPLWRREDGTRS